MQKIKILIIILISIFIIPFKVEANSISSIDMNIYIDSNGTAHIKEIWTANLDEGTEGYKPYYNIGNAKITDFTVTENNKEYETIETWETSGTLKSKAYKSGIKDINNGVELCWGISKYGTHTYELNYKIEGFVISLNDADVIYWGLIPRELSVSPEKVTVKIYSNTKYTDNLEVWGYGNDGTAYVYNGVIEMNSEEDLTSDEYMTILVKFPKGTYLTNNFDDKNFNEYYQKAEEDKNEEDLVENVLLSIIAICAAVASLIGIVCAYAYKKMHKGLKIVYVGNKKLVLTKETKKLPKDIPNYRDIPFNKDIFKTYWISECYKFNAKKEDFLGAILLKWTLENKISMIKESKGKELIIDMTKEPKFDNELEKELYDILKKASKDNLLEAKEFEKYCTKNPQKIFKWFDKVLNNETKKLREKGLITDKKQKALIVFKEKLSIVDSSIKEDAIKLKGLKNFLEEFSRIDDKEAIEVKLWEYYLIYAQILGIADKVEKQFKKLYPELLETELSEYTYNDLIMMRALTTSLTKSATIARANDYTAGGGGFSSSGGGGGAFGSSSGGGFR